MLQSVTIDEQNCRKKSTNTDVSANPRANGSSVLANQNARFAKAMNLCLNSTD